MASKCRYFTGAKVETCLVYRFPLYSEPCHDSGNATKCGIEQERVSRPAVPHCVLKEVLHIRDTPPEVGVSLLCHALRRRWNGQNQYCHICKNNGISKNIPLQKHSSILCVLFEKSSLGNSWYQTQYHVSFNGLSYWWHRYVCVYPETLYHLT